MDEPGVQIETRDGRPPAPPIQFTLRHLFAWTAWIAVLCSMAACGGAALALASLVIVAVVYPKWRQTACWLVVFLILVALFAPPQVSGPGGPSRRAQCINNLRQIVLALHNYKDNYGRFPPACVTDESGKPMHSWRVLILPYLEEIALYKSYRFDEPWDGPNNRQLAAKTLRIFRCPSSNSPPGMTNYVAVVGPGTIWADPKGTKLSDVKDGPSQTMLVVEMANSNIAWHEPRDLDIRSLIKQINLTTARSISSNHPGGAVVAFADGSVRFLDNETTVEVLEALLTAAGGETISEGDLDPP